MAAFTSEAIDRWSGAPKDEQPLFLIEALYESAVRCGASEADSLRDAIAMNLRFTINEPISTPPKPEEIELFARRLQQSDAWQSDTERLPTGTCARH